MPKPEDTAATAAENKRSPQPEPKTTADPRHKATRYDGDPHPQADEVSPALEPRDDTPWLLKKKSPPKPDSQ